MFPGQNPNFIQDYWIDAWQRAILTLDALRERGNTALERSTEHAPHVLQLRLRARARRPHAGKAGQLRAGAHRAARRHRRSTRRSAPFIVVDPRAGHGPGIGGMKQDSEIGVALAAGHPCYFVGFLPRAGARPDDRGRLPRPRRSS